MKIQIQWKENSEIRNMDQKWKVGEIFKEREREGFCYNFLVSNG